MTHAALKDRLALVRDALKPLSWAKGEAGNPSMADTVQEAIDDLSAMEGEADGIAGQIADVAWDFLVAKGYTNEDFDAVPLTIIRDNLSQRKGDTAPPPQQATKCDHRSQKWTADMRKGTCQDCGATLPATQPQQAGGDAFENEYATADESKQAMKGVCRYWFERGRLSTPPQPEAGGGVTACRDALNRFVPSRAQVEAELERAGAFRKKASLWTVTTGEVSNAVRAIIVAALSTTPASGGEHGN